MRSSWTIRTGPKSNDKCPYKKHGGETHRERGEGPSKVEAETGAMQPQAKGRMEPPGLEGAREDSPLESSEGAQPCGHLHFELLTSRTLFVTTLGNSYGFWSWEAECCRTKCLTLWKRLWN